MKRSLIAFHALLASSAVLCQSAEASSVYNAPDQLESNSLESRIEKARNGNWSSLLKSVDLDGELVAKGKWGNGGGHKQPWLRQVEERQRRQQVEQQSSQVG